MDMKWNPIIDGDLSGIPINEDLLFTVYDNWDDEPYVINGWVAGSYEEVLEITDYGWEFHNAKDVKAWMERPKPFIPGRCNMCKHWKEWIDEYGDGCAECALIENPPFILPTQNPVKYPCDR